MPVGNTPNNIVKNSKLTGLILDTFYTVRHWLVSFPHHQGIHTKQPRSFAKKKMTAGAFGRATNYGRGGPFDVTVQGRKTELRAVRQLRL